MDDQAFFEIKQKFLQRVPHPKLIQSAIDRLGTNEASVGNEPSAELDLESDSLGQFLKSYIDTLLALRLKVSNSTGPSDLRAQLHILLSLQNQLISELAKLSEFIELEGFDSSGIKLSEEIDAYKIQQFVQGNFEDDNQIKEYLRSLKTGDLQENGILEIEILRADKILQQSGQ